MTPVVGQELILIDEGNWFDEIVWRDRTDGTKSLVVERVLPGGANPRLDLRRGDRIVSFAGVFPESTDELRELAIQMSDQEASLTVLRGDRIVSLPIGVPAVESGAAPLGAEEIPQGRPGRTSRGEPAHETLELGGVPSGLGSPLSQPLEQPTDRVLERNYGSATDAFGFQVTNFRHEQYPGFDTPVLSGVLVEQVTSNSLADRSGVSAGMIIVAVDGRRVDTAAEVERWLIDRA
ncbi:MAG: hypothetical protein KDA83_11815, partial [Planctomycetales bacterium]|nr:hypothetical protein [Planctomycetales bacterium]